MRTRTTIAAVAVLLLASVPAVATTQSYGTLVYDSRAPFTVSSTDLISGRQPVATDYHAEADGGPISFATDGWDGSATTDYGTLFDTAPGGWYARYALDTTSHPWGYDITQIAVYAGTEDCRVNQDWSVSFQDISGAWTTVGPFDWSPGGSPPYYHLHYATSLIAWDDAGALAKNVVQVQFNMSYGNMHGLAAVPGTYYREMDVLGAASASVPEPLTMLAVGMGIAGLGGYIRRRRTATK